MKKPSEYMQSSRQRRIDLGLVPLRQSEIWCTPAQKKELQLKIAVVIAQVLANERV